MSIGYIDAQLNDVEAWDGTSSNIAPGHYHVKCIEIESGISNAGKPKLQAKFEIVDAVGDLAEDNIDMIGRQLNHSYSLQLDKDTVRKRLKSLVIALLGSADAKGGFNAEALVGAEMIVEVFANTYEKIDPVTGEASERVTTSMRGEQHLDNWYGPEEDGAQPAPESEPEPKPEPAKAAAPKGTGTRGRRRNSQPRV